MPDIILVVFWRYIFTEKVNIEIIDKSQTIYENLINAFPSLFKKLGKYQRIKN